MLGGGQRGELEGGRRSGADGAAGVAHLGGQFVEKRAQAMDRRAVGDGAGADLALGGRRTPCECDWVALEFGGLILVGKEHLAPSGSLAQMPLGVRVEIAVAP